MGLADDLGDLADIPSQPEPLRRMDFDHARGEGVLVTPPSPASEPVDFPEHLRALGYDPALYRVDESGVRTSVWEAQTKEGVVTMRAIRARVVARSPGIGLDADDLLREIKRYKPRKNSAPTGLGCFVAVVSDIQIGKSDGDGTLGTVDRFLASIDAVEERIRELRKSGRELGTLLVACVGDLVEACDGHYAAQTFMVELDRREQIRVMRRLLLKAMQRWSRLFDDVLLAAVAGNHGEYRRGGKAFTTPADNDDLAIPEQVYEILQANPEVFGHVRAAIGGDPFTRVVEAGGHVVGMLHGHMARESGTAAQKIQRWYERQAAAKAPVGEANVVLSGHYHHLSVTESNGAVTFIQAPSLDGGSDWYQAAKAAQTNPGFLTFCLYPSDARVQDIKVL